jgi:peptidoglycan/LPS O-acetylase OafA/YrhL
MEQNESKNLGIERLRAVAVLMTVICHLNYGRLPQILSNAWAGVDLFFVISGYVIARSFARLASDISSTNQNWLERLEKHRTIILIFFIKRAYRILPLALLVAVCWFLWLVNSTSEAQTTSVSKEFLAILSGVHNYWIATEKQVPHFVLYWSLAVEEHFYFFFPFLYVLLANPSQRIAAAIAAIATCAFVIRPLSLTGIDSAQMWAWRAETHLRFDTIACGVVIALLRERGWGAAFAKTSRALRLSAFALISLLWILPSMTSYHSGERVSSALLFSNMLLSGALVFLASVNAGNVIAIPVIKNILEYIGSRSYALYLSHILVASISVAGLKKAQEFFAMNETSDIFKALIMFGSVFLAAELLYRWVERPFILRGARRVAILKKNMASPEETPSKFRVAA